jgi:hypothetical protein
MEGHKPVISAVVAFRGVQHSAMSRRRSDGGSSKGIGLADQAER